MARKELEGNPNNREDAEQLVEYFVTYLRSLNQLSEGLISTLKQRMLLEIQAHF
jgi:hypothetical protein